MLLDSETVYDDSFFIIATAAITKIQYVYENVTLFEKNQVSLKDNTFCNDNICEWHLSSSKHFTIIFLVQANKKYNKFKYMIYVKVYLDLIVQIYNDQYFTIVSVMLDK